MRTVLYSTISPIGLGGKYVESLSSYIIRLADAHCVPPGKLLKQVISKWLPESNFRTNLERGSFTTEAHRINYSLEIVNAIEILTSRNEIIYLTPLSWKSLFGAFSAFAKKKKWCPCCFEERRNNKEELYEPLIWGFDDVRYCLRHNVELEKQCVSCLKDQAFISLNSRIGYCNYCGNWLGKLETEGVSIEQSDLTSVLEEALEYMADDMVYPLPHLFNTRINEIKSILRCTTNELSLIFEISPNTLWQWVRGTLTPTYYSLFIFCTKYNCSFQKVFIEGEFISILPIEEVLKGEYDLKISSRKVNQKELQRLLEDNLKLEKPLNVDQLVRRYNIHRKTIRQNFPELFQLTVSRHSYNHEIRLARCKEELNNLISNPEMFEKGDSFFKIFRKYRIGYDIITEKNPTLHEAVINSRVSANEEKKQRLKLFLEEVIENNLYMDLSIKEILNNRGFTSYQARTYFPELIKIIVERNSANRKVVRQKKIVELKRNIEQTMREMHKEGESISFRNVAKAISKPGFYNDLELKEHYWNIRKSLLQ